MSFSGAVCWCINWKTQMIQNVSDIWFQWVYGNQAACSCILIECFQQQESLPYFSSSLPSFSLSSPFSQGILWNSWWDTSSLRLGHEEWRSKAVRMSPILVSYVVNIGFTYLLMCNMLKPMIWNCKPREGANITLDTNVQYRLHSRT